MNFILIDKIFLEYFRLSLIAYMYHYCSQDSVVLRLFTKTSSTVCTGKRWRRHFCSSIYPGGVSGKTLMFRYLSSHSFEVIVILKSLTNTSSIDKHHFEGWAEVLNRNFRRIVFSAQMVERIPGRLLHYDRDRYCSLF